MKLVIALIPSAGLVSVQAALRALGAGPVTAAEVLDCGSTEGQTEYYRGQAVRRGVSRIRLEVVVDEDNLKSAVQTILHAGGRRVFVMVLDECAGVRA
jgi:nitrogen regulatory protein PII